MLLFHTLPSLLFFMRFAFFNCPAVLYAQQSYLESAYRSWFMCMRALQNSTLGYGPLTGDLSHSRQHAGNTTSSRVPGHTAPPKKGPMRRVFSPAPQIAGRASPGRRAWRHCAGCCLLAGRYATAVPPLGFHTNRDFQHAIPSSRPQKIGGGRCCSRGGLESTELHACAGRGEENSRRPEGATAAPCWAYIGGLGIQVRFSGSPLASEEA
jgi:hypothetical protein